LSAVISATTKRIMTKRGAQKHKKKKREQGRGGERRGEERGKEQLLLVKIVSPQNRSVPLTRKCDVIPLEAKAKRDRERATKESASLRSRLRSSSGAICVV